MQSFGTRCGDTYFGYLLNNTSAKVAVPFSFVVVGKKTSVQSIVPTTRQYEKLTHFGLKNQQLTLRDLTLEPQQERVLIVKTAGGRP